MVDLKQHRGASGISDVHYYDQEFKGGITCTAAEATLLLEAARIRRPARALEIGSYIGWSTAHIASALKQELDCVEPFLVAGGARGEEEKDLAAEARFWKNVRACHVGDRIRLAHGKSPEALPSIAPQQGWEFAFVDGWHQHGQPLRDVLGVEPHLHAGALVVLHDLWVPDVRDAAVYLNSRGYHLLIVPTANFLCFATRDEESAWWGELRVHVCDRRYILENAVKASGKFGLNATSIQQAAGLMAGGLDVVGSVTMAHA